MIEWRDAMNEEFVQLNKFLGQIMSGLFIEMPINCPVHLSPNPCLHVYFNRHGRSGGIWVWCSNCGIYIHGRITPPAWWSNLEVLDETCLTAQPQYLNAHAREIDNHWNNVMNRKQTQTAQ